MELFSLSLRKCRLVELVIEYLTKLIEALHLAVYSYIKPAAPHRFSSRFKDLETIIFTATSSLDVYSQAFTAGLDISTGKETLYSIGIGRLFYHSLAKSYRKLGIRAYQALNLVLVPTSLSIGYSARQQHFVNSYKRIFSAVLEVNNPKDVVALVDGIRQFYGIGSVVLVEQGLTPSKLATEKPSIGDVLLLMGVKARDLLYTLKRMDYVFEVGTEVARMISSGADPNDVAVRAFLRLAQTECEKLRRVSEIDQKSLYDLDKELLRDGVDLSYLITPLTLALLLSNYLSEK
ncbi:MAG: hypothetical protein QW543_02605 [Sulfolobales archaeon]